MADGVGDPGVAEAVDGDARGPYPTLICSALPGSLAGNRVTVLEPPLVIQIRSHPSQDAGFIFPLHHGILAKP